MSSGASKSLVVPAYFKLGILADLASALCTCQDLHPRLRSTTFWLDHPAVSVSVEHSQAVAIVMAAFGGQTPTIIVLKEGKRAFLAFPAMPTNHSQAPTLLKAKARSLPISMLA